MTNAASVTLVGRDLELRQAASVLDRVRTQHVATAVRIDGISGIGKTALVQEISRQARAAGWLTVFLAAHRIQKMLPYVVARKIVSGIVQELGDDGGRYTSGLDAEIAKSVRGDHSKEAIEESLLRLTEAVSLDRPIAIFLDDAHWADRESTELVDRLMQALADRPIVLFYTERGDQNEGRTFEFTDTSIALGELDRPSLELLARAVLKSASEEVIKTVAQHARGRALDVVTLAASVPDAATLTPERAAETLRALVARDLALLDAKAREFLQICSLISDPIEYALLKQLWSDDAELMAYIHACSGRYLRQEGDALHFIHAAVAQSIRETVPIEIPYRRRIMDALERLPERRFEDLERLVDQAAASGDRMREKTYLAELLRESERLQALPIVARALERIIVLTPFEAATSLPLYSKLSMTYNALARVDDTHRICSEALNFALAEGVSEGIGQLVASELFALFFRGDDVAFARTLEQFDRYLRSPEDRAQLSAVKLLVGLRNADDAAFNSARREFDALNLQNPLFETRFDIFDAWRLARNGDTEASLSAIHRSLEGLRVRDVAPVMRVMVDDGHAYMSFLAYGPGHPEVSAAIESLPKFHETRTYLSALSLLAQGNAADVLAYTSDVLIHYESFARRLILGAAAGSAALAGVALPGGLQKLVDADVTVALRGSVTGWLRPIAASASLLYAATDASLARTLLRKTIDVSRRPIEPMVLLIPLLLVRAAIALQDETALRQIEAGELAHNRDPWNTAHDALARLSARVALGRSVAADESGALVERFRTLGAPYFSLLAAELRSTARSMLPAPSGNKLSRREHEVAGLIAEGATNREIANRLVLSERTVESHVANILGKLDASSRAQVAAWYARHALTSA